jgi:hypothetical protein
LALKMTVGLTNGTAAANKCHALSITYVGCLYNFSAFSYPFSNDFILEQLFTRSPV